MYEKLRVGLKEILPNSITAFIRAMLESRRIYLQNTRIAAITNKMNREGRVINLGKFLSCESEIALRQMTYISGGSNVLDYALLRVLMLKFNLQIYCEIGTYIGESINVVSDITTVCHSITAGEESPYSMKNYCKDNNIPCYSERLAKASNIVHHYVDDSATFDWTTIKDNIDLYFIDGNHSYEGVCADTRNVFQHKKEDAFVIWHDFKGSSSTGVVLALYDTLGEQFENLFYFDNNLCAIYIPPKFQANFPVHQWEYSERSLPLYVYDTNIKPSLISDQS